MFLLALTAFLLLAPGLSARAAATGNKAAIRAADREGMPERAHTNHPAHTREARVTSDASSPAASAAVSPAPFGTSKPETSNTTADAPTHVLLPSASPAPSRGLALGVSCDRAGQPLLRYMMQMFGLDLSSCTASPRPRITCGETGRRRAVATTTPAFS